VAGGTAVAVIAAMRRERQHAALVRTANVAEVAQRALLRPLDERYDGVDLAVRYVSAEHEALIGGDLYDVEVTPWGLRVLIADVCGHGLPAVEKASMITFAFREAAHACDTLGDVVDAIEKSFLRQIRPPDFVTALLLEVNGNDVRIANCGHPDPALIDRHRLKWLAPQQRARPIGLGTSPTPQRLFLAQGERLLLYTDGLTDARNASGGFFDLEMCALASFATNSLDEALDQLIKSLVDHSDGALTDDVLALAVQLTATP
jgi:phosphoserine phosphatase RsbU/P